MNVKEKFDITVSDIESHRIRGNFTTLIKTITKISPLTAQLMPEHFLRIVIIIVPRS